MQAADKSSPRQGASAIAMVLVALLGGVLFFWRYSIADSPRLTSAPLAAGDFLPARPTIATEGGTLVLAIRAGCRYCWASMPFYRELARSAREGTFPCKLAVAMPDESSIAISVLSANRLALPLRTNEDFAALGIDATPTLVLIGPRRRVQRVWVGQLSPAVEEQVLRSKC